MKLLKCLAAACAILLIAASALCAAENAKPKNVRVYIVRHGHEVALSAAGLRVLRQGAQLSPVHVGRALILRNRPAFPAHAQLLPGVEAVHGGLAPQRRRPVVVPRQHMGARRLKLSAHLRRRLPRMGRGDHEIHVLEDQHLIPRFTRQHKALAAVSRHQSLPPAGGAVGLHRPLPAQAALQRRLGVPGHLHDRPPRHARPAVQAFHHVFFTMCLHSTHPPAIPFCDGFCYNTINDAFCPERSGPCTRS